MEARKGGIIAFTEDGTVCVMESDGTAIKRLTTGFDPQISPDGSKIAFSRVGGPGNELCVIDRNGSGLKVLATGTTSVGEPSWSPDGTRIAYARKNGALSMDIMIVRVSDGANLGLVANDACRPAWSVNDVIAYTSPVASPRGLFIKPVGGPTATNITPSGLTPAPSVQDPCWMLDGITVMAVDRGDPTNMTLFSVDSTATVPAVATNYYTFPQINDPTCIPGTSRVLFVGGIPRQIFQWDISGGTLVNQVVLRTGNLGPDCHPTWAP